MAVKKHVVFDVVGTLVSFQSFYAAIEDVLGPRLRQHGLSSQAFGYAWMTAAELEFTFLSISERHRPYRDVLASTFHRTLFLAGVPDPRALVPSTEDRDACIAGYASLTLRPGAAECLKLLQDAGFEVLFLTTADPARVRGYFKNTAVSLPDEAFISCDTHGVAKPALQAYRPVLEQFAPADKKWFAAAHMWDVSAAKKVGFRGAYCSVLEKEACLDIFGEDMDVMASSLPEMAQKIIELTGSE